MLPEGNFKMKLDSKTVARLTLPDGKNDLIHFDDELAGFGFRLRRSADKTRKSWVVQYRRGKRTRRVMLAPFDAMSADVARKAARKLLGAVWTGHDPQAEKQAKRDREEHTLRKVTSDYLEARQDEWRGRSGSEIERYLTGSYFRPLHAKPLAEIDRRDVNACIATMKRANGTVAATRALTALQSLFTWAIRAGLIDTNPVTNVNKPAPLPPRDRVLADAELAAVWRACGDDDAGRVTKLMILTAARRGEVGGMRWREIDLDKGTWTLPKERAKNTRAHILPLPPLALSIIEAVPQVANKDTLFGERSEHGFTRWWQAKLGLDERLGDAVGSWRFHDLRRSAATGMANLGIQPHVIECVLNHQAGFRSGVASVYNKSPYMNEMRDAMLRWADHIRVLVEGGERKVVSLHAAS
jgi:integrase